MVRQTPPPVRARSRRLLHADCLGILPALPRASIDLIHVDPPLGSGRDRTGGEERGYRDRWPDLQAYLDWIGPRLAALRGLLTRTGSMYVHLDFHAVHYVKVLLDGLFGARNFLNEVVWLYGLGGSSARYGPRKHDTPLW